MPEQEPNEYSREAYIAADQEVKAAKGKISPETPTEELRQAVDEKANTELKRGQLHEMAWDEALKINDQYDELYSRKDQIDQEIATFRTEKLGMGEPREVAEAEKGEPTLEQQAQVYSEMFGVDSAKILELAQSLQAEMSEQERKELTMLIYLPEGVTTKDAWDKVKSENPTWQSIEPEEITTEGETPQRAIVAFSRYSQEPDEDSLGEHAKSAKEWEKIDQKFMSPRLRMIAGEYYRRAEGKQLDEKNATISPGSRSAHGDVPSLYFNPNSGEVSLYGYDPGSRVPDLGVRRVVSKEA